MLNKPDNAAASRGNDLPQHFRTSSRLPVIFLVTLLFLTVVLWRIYDNGLIERSRLIYNDRISKVSSEIIDQMHDFELMLRGATSLFSIKDDVSRADWHSYVDALHLDDTHPGLQGIGLSMLLTNADKEAGIRKIRAEGFPGFAIHPAGERPTYAPVIYIEPFGWRNQLAFGFDPFAEAVRRGAMERARDENVATVAAKVILALENGKENQAGFLIYVPVYRKGMMVNTVAERRAACVGFAFAPVRMNDFVSATISKPLQDIAFDIRIGANKSGKYTGDNQMYSSTQALKTLLPGKYTPAITTTENVEVYGCSWQFTFKTLPGFNKETNRMQSYLFLLGGIFFSVVVSYLLLALLKSRDKIIVNETMEYAENIVDTVREAMVVLDSDLKIISANHSFYETFKVNPEDTIAQYIYNLGNGQWNIPALQILLEDILPRNSVFDNYKVEHIFPDIGRKIILLNARQIFREATGSHIILLAMEDVTERMDAEEKLQSAMEEITVQYEELQDQQIELELQADELHLANNAKDKLNAKANDALEYSENIIETVREPMVVLDSDLKIISANHSFYETFAVNPADTIARYLYDLGDGQWNIPALQLLLENILPNDAVINGYEVEHDFPGIGLKTMLLNARQVFRETVGSNIILLAMEDITVRKDAEKKLQIAAEEIAAQNEELRVQQEELIQQAEELHLAGIAKDELHAKTNDALEYSENIIETVREAMVVLDSDLKIISANHSFYETFKVNPEDTIARFIYDLGNGQWNIPALQILLEDIIPGNSVFDNYKVEHTFSDIGRKIILLNARQIFREATGSHIILLAMEDVTERMDAEEKLQSAMEEITVQNEELQDQQIELELQADELQLANVAKDELQAKTKDALKYADSIIDTVREAMVVLDSDLKIISANQSFYETFNVNPEDTIARYIYDLGNGQWNIPALQTLLEDILPHNSVFDNYEVEHVFPDVGHKVILLNAREIFREATGSHIILLAMEDITERKQLERRLEIAYDNLELIADERKKALNSVTAQKLELVESNRLLVVSSQAKSVFMANMNHELRTPLNSIIGFSEVLQDQLYGAINEMQSDCVDDIISSGKHLLSLINDILDITKVESGKMELQLGIFSLREILDNSLDMLTLKAQKGAICLSMDLAPQADMDIEADQRKLKQILYNLLSNAVKFTPMGGTVSVVVEREGNYIKTAVVDSGIGIREEDVPKLFQPFTQLLSDDNKTFEGTGLGLALTKQLVELHGGRMWLTSLFGSGSTFGFTIPLGQNSGDDYDAAYDTDQSGQKE